jgi:hypothetical protein
MGVFAATAKADSPRRTPGRTPEIGTFDTPTDTIVWVIARMMYR